MEAICSSETLGFLQTTLLQTKRTYSSQSPLRTSDPLKHTAKSYILCDIMLCSPLKANRHFRQTCRLHLQGWRVVLWCDTEFTWYMSHNLAYSNSLGWWMMMIVEHSVEWELAGETKVLGGNLPQCHLVHHKSQMNWPGIEPGQSGD
jgi:hypothetical protein